MRITFDACLVCALLLVKSINCLLTVFYNIFIIRRINNSLSVTMAEIYLFGVTSNAGFLTFTPSGAILIPLIWVISIGFRSSIGI